MAYAGKNPLCYTIDREPETLYNDAFGKDTVDEKLNFIEQRQNEIDKSIELKCDELTKRFEKLGGLLKKLDCERVIIKYKFESYYLYGGCGILNASWKHRNNPLFAKIGDILYEKFETKIMKLIDKKYKKLTINIDQSANLFKLKKELEDVKLDNNSLVGGIKETNLMLNTLRCEYEVMEKLKENFSEECNKLKDEVREYKIVKGKDLDTFLEQKDEIKRLEIQACSLDEVNDKIKQALKESSEKYEKLELKQKWVNVDNKELKLKYKNLSQKYDIIFEEKDDKYAKFQAEIDKLSSVNKTLQQQIKNITLPDKCKCGANEWQISVNYDGKYFCYECDEYISIHATKDGLKYDYDGFTVHDKAPIKKDVPYPDYIRYNCSCGYKGMKSEYEIQRPPTTCFNCEKELKLELEDQIWVLKPVEVPVPSEIEYKCSCGRNGWKEKENAKKDKVNCMGCGSGLKLELKDNKWVLNPVEVPIPNQIYYECRCGFHGLKCSTDYNLTGDLSCYECGLRLKLELKDGKYTLNPVEIDVPVPDKVNYVCKCGWSCYKQPFDKNEQYVCWNCKAKLKTEIIDGSYTLTSEEFSKSLQYNCSCGWTSLRTKPLVKDTDKECRECKRKLKIIKVDGERKLVAGDIPVPEKVDYKCGCGWEYYKTPFYSDANYECGCCHESLKTEIKDGKYILSSTFVPIPKYVDYVCNCGHKDYKGTKIGDLAPFEKDEQYYCFDCGHVLKTEIKDGEYTLTPTDVSVPNGVHYDCKCGWSNFKQPFNKDEEYTCYDCCRKLKTEIKDGKYTLTPVD